jgi:hypothetical protein
VSGPAQVLKKGASEGETAPPDRTTKAAALSGLSVATRTLKVVWRVTPSLWGRMNHRRLVTSKRSQGVKRVRDAEWKFPFKAM